jgi:hypothetical protein
MMRVILLLLLAAPALAAEIGSTRDTSYDFQTQTLEGVAISNHTRFDTAFVACLNNPSCVYVQGGRYRINRPVTAPIVTPPVIATGTAFLTWLAPTHWPDGTVITGTLTYRLEWGCGNFATVTPVTGLAHNLTALPPCSYQFRLYALQGTRVSAPSNTVTKVIP